MTPAFKKVLIQKAANTGMFYLLAAAAIYILEKAGPSGPCTPGFGMLVLMIMPFVTFVLLSINLFKLFNGDKTNAAAALMHMLVLGIYFFTLTT